MAANPRWYLSGSGIPANSLGGSISGTLAPTNLFDDVSGAESAAGDVEYRGVYVKNDGDVDLLNTVVWIQVKTPDADTDVAIALADEGSNQTMEVVADENTPPVGPLFSSPASAGTGLSLGTLSAGQVYGVWIRRTVSVGAAAYAGDTFTIRVQGDSFA